MSEVCIKQGDSLLLTMAFFNDDGSSVDLTSVTLSAQVRDASDNQVAVLTLTKTAILNIATVSYPDTSLWPTGLLRADIRAASAGLNELSETFGIRVNRTVTR